MLAFGAATAAGEGAIEGETEGLVPVETLKLTPGTLVTPGRVATCDLIASIAAVDVEFNAADTSTADVPMI